MALQLLLMCVFKLGTHTHVLCVYVRMCVLRGRERLLARSTGKASKQAQQWLLPVEDVTALPSTQALPLTFKLWKQDIKRFSQVTQSLISNTVKATYVKILSVKSCSVYIFYINNYSVFHSALKSGMIILQLYTHIQLPLMATTAD